MSRITIKSRWVIILAILALSSIAFSSCHADGCPNKIVQVNPFGNADVS